MERPDTFLLGFVLGAVTVIAAIGITQMLVTKGYTIAADLVEAGWNARELRAHKKAAVILPWIESMKAEARSQR